MEEVSLKALSLNSGYSTALKFIPGVDLGPVSRELGITSSKSCPCAYNQRESPPVPWVFLQQPKASEGRVNSQSDIQMTLSFFFLAFHLGGLVSRS